MYSFVAYVQSILAFTGGKQISFAPNIMDNFHRYRCVLSFLLTIEYCIGGHLISLLILSSAGLSGYLHLFDVCKPCCKEYHCVCIFLTFGYVASKQILRNGISTNNILVQQYRHLNVCLIVMLNCTLKSLITTNVIIFQQNEIIVVHKSLYLFDFHTSLLNFSFFYKQDSSSGYISCSYNYKTSNLLNN